ncbi:uncharacterized protein DMENIID0001_091090 [Sergentomyia squamirostris]
MFLFSFTKVNTGNAQKVSRAPMAKRVAPPSVPDIYRNSSGSFGSVSFPIEEISSDRPHSGMFRPTRDQLTHKTTMLFHQQMALQEDQGIDLTTQSSGRDSPDSSSGSAGSGSRHSTASLDSGRASSYLTTASTRGGLSSPRCSMSSCSITSVERMIRNDHDIIHDWLAEIECEEYAHCFTVAGYDLPTVARMTPEDLTAVGIKSPHHRERIKHHIDSLHLPDVLPNYVPGSIDEWLHLLRLEEYIQPLLSQGYQSVRDVTQLTWEDLEDIGIVKLGHQKKILLAIKRVRDIISGKWVAPPGQNHMMKIEQTDELPNTTPQVYYHPDKINKNDIVVIQLRQGRGKSLESLEDPADRMNFRQLTFNVADAALHCHPEMVAHQMQQHPYQNILVPPFTNMPWRRSYEDGDLTPTNEAGCMEMGQGGGTLPRQARVGARTRPVAKVVANVCVPVRQIRQVDPVKPWVTTVDGKKEPPSPPRRHIAQLVNGGDMFYTPPSFVAQQPAHLHHTTAEVHSVVFPSSEAKSASSMDSIDAIPFANDNAGTIKQRISRGDGQQVSLSSSSSSTSSTSSTNTVAHIVYDDRDPISPTAAPPPPLVDSNVLNDIGNMLANLTDELDAMLEEEKRAGLNDSE